MYACALSSLPHHMLQCCSSVGCREADRFHGGGTVFGLDLSATADWARLAGVEQLHLSTAGLQHWGAWARTTGLGASTRERKHGAWPWEGRGLVGLLSLWSFCCEGTGLVSSLLLCEWKVRGMCRHLILPVHLLFYFFLTLFICFIFF